MEKLFNDKKIAYIINADWYFKLHWLDRAKAAMRDGFEVHLICHFTDIKNGDYFKKLGFNCYHLNLSRSGVNPYSELQSILTLKQLIRSIAPDLIHSVTIKPNLYAGFLARSLEIPIVGSVTGLGSVFASDLWMPKCLSRLVLHGYRFLSGSQRYYLLFENSSDRELFLHNGSAREAMSEVVSGAGVDTDEFAFKTINNGSAVIVLFAARLIKEKGLELLVEAISNLRSQGENIELWVAGITDSTAKNPISVSQLNSWQKEGVIHFLGNRSDMSDLLARSDIVCLPTMYREGIPRVLIEAGSVGRPVITSDVSGCDELVIDGENGFLVKPNCVADLESKLKCLADDRVLRSKMGLKARAVVVQSFSNKIVIDQHLEVYSRMLNDSVL